jgi:hypothetical protein
MKKLFNIAACQSYNFYFFLCDIVARVLKLESSFLIDKRGDFPKISYFPRNIKSEKLKILSLSVKLRITLSNYYQWRI